MIKRLPTFFLKFFWVWLSFLLCIWLSWQTLAQVNFLYPIWHDYAGIGQNIDQYAPLNHYKPGFEATSDDTRKQLFAGIVDAIQHQGKGLSHLNYSFQNQTIMLLRPAEIIHLQDVANLISWLNQITLWLFIAWIALLIYYIKKPLNLPKNNQAWYFLGAGLALIGVLLWLFGAKEVFYQLHIWIFPNNHQWFFYYQDSLMSTMMKAPDLFGYIAIILLLFGLGFLSILQFSLPRLLRPLRPKP